MTHASTSKATSVATRAASRFWFAHGLRSTLPLALALLLSATALAPAAPQPGRGILFGAYTYGGVWRGMEPVQDVERTLGRRLDIVHWYMNWSHDWDADLVTAAARGGRIPLISWQPHEVRVEQIARGRYDSYLRSWARGAERYGRPVYLRPFPEMNGFWTDWNGNPEALVAAWRHIVDLFREEGADNVLWVWAPNIRDEPNTATNRLERYYPGSDYVDILALDGFNWGTTRPYTAWRSFEETFAAAYARVTSLGPQPVWITEVASAERGGDKSAWVREMLTHDRFPRLEALVWFDEDKEADWRVTSSQPVLRSFRTYLR